MLVKWRHHSSVQVRTASTSSYDSLASISLYAIVHGSLIVGLIRHCSCVGLHFYVWQIESINFIDAIKRGLGSAQMSPAIIPDPDSRSDLYTEWRTERCVQMILPWSMIHSKVSLSSSWGVRWMVGGSAHAVLICNLRHARVRSHSSSSIQHPWTSAVM